MLSYGVVRVWYFLVCMVIGITICTGCMQAKRPSSLILLPGAQGVQYQVAGTSQLTYKLSEKYPASASLNEISNRLQKQGWKPLKEDFLNPGSLTSNVSGWTEFFEDSHGEMRTGKQWFGQWTNDAGDVVEYVLRYSWPLNGETNTQDLTVGGIYVPAKLAREMHKYASRAQKQDARLK